MAVIRRLNYQPQYRLDLPDLQGNDMSDLFYAVGRGPCKIEVTTADGEKFSYNAVITHHEIQMGPSNAIYTLGGDMIEECASSRSKEVTLRFVELSPKTWVKSKPVKKNLDQQLRKAIEEEEML